MAQRPAHHAMPDDAWEFLDSEDDTTTATRSSEEAAMHTTRDQPVLALRDPAAREVDIGYDDDAPVARWFDDEEPEPPYALSRNGDSDTDVDLEDILETQHYAFPDEDDNENEAEFDSAEQ